MRARLFVLLLAVTGCDLVFGLDRRPAPDGANSADACSLSTEFAATRQNVEIFVAVSDPTIRGDLLEVFFVTNSASDGQEIYHATRPTADSPFDLVEPVAELNSPADETDPTVSEDGLVLMFRSNRQTVVRAFEARRPSVTARFLAPIRVDGLNNLAVSSLDLAPDGLAVYFDDGDSLETARRPGLEAPFVIGLPAAGATPRPAIARDEQELYYDGPDGIMRATRTSIADPFGPGVSFMANAHGVDISANDSTLVAVTGTTLIEGRRSCTR